MRPRPRGTLFPYTTLFRSLRSALDSRTILLTSFGLFPKRSAVQEGNDRAPRSEEHTSELQSRGHLVCRRLLEKTTKLRQADASSRTRHPYSCAPEPESQGC